MRLRVVTVVFTLLALCAVGISAGAGQEPPTPPTPATPSTPAPPARPAPPAAAPQPPQPPERPQAARPAVRAPGAEPSKGVNIRVDATVTESRGTEVVAKKVLSVTVVDGENGSVRSTLSVPFQPKGSPGFSYDKAPLNMDARVRLLDDNRVRVALVLDYKGGRLETADGQEGAEAIDQGIRQAVTVVLENGKPMVVAQSADAIGERRVTLEVKATVLK